jgi:hypothetical protein
MIQMRPQALISACAINNWNLTVCTQAILFVMQASVLGGFFPLSAKVLPTAPRFF